MGVAFAYTAPDYLAAMLALGHRGRAWPIEPDTVRAAAMTGLTGAYVRSGARAVNLITDAFPKTTIELLPEWEKSLGLPDICETDASTLQSRQAAVTARFVAAGGQSIDYFVSVAAALGYTITITEFRALRFGDPMGTPMYSPPWVHVWQVNAPLFTVSSIRFGDFMGEPFRSWGNTALQCTLRRLAPAHTVLQFNYS
jgi:uncharacterized protein YmfQ (DUF2313 family)